MNNNSSIFGNTEIKMSAHRESRPEIVANRRNFLKKLAVFAGSSGVLTSMPWWSPLRADPPGGSALDRVRLGVIGVGSRGQKLMLHLLQTPGVEIAAVCDDTSLIISGQSKKRKERPKLFTITASCLR